MLISGINYKFRKKSTCYKTAQAKLILSRILKGQDKNNNFVNYFVGYGKLLLVSMEGCEL
jgi:hypothetical protein